MLLHFASKGLSRSYDYWPGSSGVNIWGKWSFGWRGLGLTPVQHRHFGARRMALAPPTFSL